MGKILTRPQTKGANEMSIAICRVQKIKGAGAVTGIQIHNRREREHSNSNPDIDFSRSDCNYTLNDTSDVSYNTLIANRLKNGYTGEKTVRKDAVTLCEALFTSDCDFFKGMSETQQRAFFEDCYVFAEQRYGSDNIISATVHLDEATPHMHLNFVPLTADGRLSAKEVIGLRADLQELQDDFFEKIGKKYQLDRGKRADLQNPKDKPTKHLTVQEMKERTEQELMEKKQQITSLQSEIDKLTTTLTNKELEKIDTTPRLTGGFKGLSPKQAQELVNTSKSIRLENKGLRTQVKNLSAERDGALDRARNAEEKIKTIQFSTTRSYSAQIAELSNQNRLLKKVIGISENAKYDEVHLALKNKGLLENQNNQNKNYQR